MDADIRARTLLAKIFVRGVVDLATLGGVLFGIAGRVDWPAAWFILLLFTGHLVLSGWWLFRHTSRDASEPPPRLISLMSKAS